VADADIDAAVADIDAESDVLSPVPAVVAELAPLVSLALAIIEPPPPHAVQPSPNATVPIKR
jgi:hypothetical protein